MSKQQKIGLLIFVAVVFLGVLLYFSEWFAVDRCLDSGGALDHEKHVCTTR